MITVAMLNYCNIYAQQCTPFICWYLRMTAHKRFLSMFSSVQITEQKKERRKKKVV